MLLNLQSLKGQYALKSKVTISIFPDGDIGVFFNVYFLLCSSKLKQSIFLGVDSLKTWTGAAHQFPLVAIATDVSVHRADGHPTGGGVGRGEERDVPAVRPQDGAGVLGAEKKKKKSLENSPAVQKTRFLNVSVSVLLTGSRQRKRPPSEAAYSRLSDGWRRGEENTAPPPQ